MITSDFTSEELRNLESEYFNYVVKNGLKAVPTAYEILKSLKNGARGCKILQSIECYLEDDVLIQLTSYDDIRWSIDYKERDVRGYFVTVEYFGEYYLDGALNWLVNTVNNLQNME